ncbi:MAG: lipid kinase [Gammaproteobacteria bacterium]
MNEEIRNAAIPRRALWIVNPKSRQGSTDLAEARALLERGGIRLREAVPDDATDVARSIEAHAGEVDCVIVGGGDGTLNCAAPAIVDRKLPLGILPLGTANDLARTLGLPTGLREAAGVIVNGHARKIDIGRANDVYFFNAADIGLGARVTARLDRGTKRRWGMLAYPRALLGAWRGNRAFSAQIRCDDREETVRAIQLKIANGKYYGGGASVLEDAAIDDERLDLLAIRPQGMLDLLRLAPAVRVGAARASPRVDVRSARKIDISTRRRMEISTDGEITTATPARFRVVPRAVTVYVPAPARVAIRGDEAC